LLTRRRAELDPALVTFIEASVRAAREADRRRTRVRTIVTAALAGLLFVAAAAAAVGWKKQLEAQAANETVGVVQRLDRHTSDIGTSPQRSLLLSVYAASLSKDRQEGMLTAIDGLRQQLHTIGGRPLQGHGMAIRTAAFSPDQRWLANGSEDGAIRLWDLSPVDPTSRVLDGHKGPVHGLAFSADRRWLVSGAADGTVRLWRLTAEGAKPDRVFDEGRYGAIQSLAPQPERRLACLRHTGRQRLHLEDVRRRAAGRTLRGVEG
jgi:WD40 repeat protein